MNPTDGNLKHPCFNHSVHKELARIHLPVAPDCNIQCNFCNRLYDCVNETRPGVTSKILTPEQASKKYFEIKQELNNITIVGFAGPGDPLANFDKIKKTVELIREKDKKVDFCLSTNGLMASEYAEEIVKTGFSYVTITINSITPEIGAEIYDYIIYKDEFLKGKEASELLIQKQLKGLEILSSRGVVCKVNTLYVKGINDFQIKDIAKLASEKGAYLMNIKNLIPTKGSRFENFKTAPIAEIDRLRKACSGYIKQMYHCQQCRADSAGLISEDKFKNFY